MKCILKITDVLDVQEEQIYDAFCTPYDMGLQIYIEKENELKKRLKDKKTFEECMDGYIEWSKQILVDEELYSENLMCADFLKMRFDRIVDIVDYVLISFNRLNVKKLLKENPTLMNKKLILYECLSIIEEEKMNELLIEYADIKEKIYIYLDGNDEAISLVDCKKTMDKIKEKAKEIKKLGLSPMESVMYLYDQVRNRVYKYEDENESVFKSRDLTQVMFGDEIVCVGYANIMHAVLNHLGIRSKIVFLDSTDSNELGHARNVAYINDPKYDIDGVYYFDATWNSKLSENDTDFTTNYSFFAKTKNYMDEYAKDYYIERDISKYTDDIYEIIEENLNEKNYEILVNYIRTINNMSKLALGETMIEFYRIFTLDFTEEEIREILDKLALVCDKYDKEIGAEVMLKVFNNVRKIEHYQNEELYPYSINTIYKAMICSEWKFSDDILSTEEKILKMLFDEAPSEKDCFIRCMADMNIKKEIAQVELVKTLRLVKNKKLGK